jgi:hypothetical protein
MTYNQFYFAASIPQWEIFFGVACVIIGYIEKKERWMTAGWIIFFVTGLTLLSFNLSEGLGAQPDKSISESAVNSLTTAGWQCATGAVLGAASLLFQRLKTRYFKFIAILTIIYFMLVFFQFNHIMRSQSKVKKPMNQTEQNNN